MASSLSKNAVKLDNGTVEVKAGRSRPILFALMLGLVGAFLNCFPIELAYNISLIIGNLAFIIAAAYLRPVLTLLCAFICITPLLIILGHPFGFLTFGLEALFVSYMRGRGWYLPTADFLYWLLIGMPLTAALVWLNNSDSQGFILFLVFKQNINAVFYTSIAVIFVLVFNDLISRWLKSQQPPLLKSLKQYLHYILWIMSAFFVVGACLFLSRSFNQLQQQQVVDKLDMSSQFLAHAVTDYVDDHKKAIEQISNQLSYIAPSEHANTLDKAHKLYPGFLTMLIANDNADIVSSSPRDLMGNLPKKFVSIADRAYFTRAFFEQTLYVSPVFLGRGFGVDPIIAISAPIYAQDKVKPIGVVEGSLNLNMFKEINNYATNNQAIDLVLTDEKDSIIYADTDIELKILSKLNFTVDQTSAKYKLMQISPNGVNGYRFFYRQLVLENGWKLFVLIEHQQILKLTEHQYLTIFIALFLIFTLVVLLANQFANALNRPLAFALKELAKGESLAGYKAIPYDAPSEFLTLYDKLQRSKAQLLKQQAVLEEQVANRTTELNNANIALKELANKDSLTGLYNRRYLEKKFSELQAILSRNNACMVVAMLDLDHFKKLNDEYGHLIGDNCLTYISDVMKRKFDRRSDIVARFGGEEFIIVVQSDDNKGVLQMLEEFREEIAQHSFPHNAHHFVNITISIGAVTAKAQLSANIDDWIRLADEQLYKSKTEGRNRLSYTDFTDVSEN